MSDGFNNFGFDATIAAGADLSSLQYHVIGIAGTIATTTDAAIGVLQNKPKSGEAAQVKVIGQMMGKAGGTIAAAAKLKLTTSGTLIAVASGDNIAPIGKNMNTAVASGDVFTFFGNFINGATVLTSSL